MSGDAAQRSVTAELFPARRDERIWRAIFSLAAIPGPKPRAAGHVENLVFEFDEAYTAYIDSMEVLPSEAQLTSLQAIDTKLSRMVRAKEASLWGDAAWRDDPNWDEVRALSAHALEEFGWPSTGAASHAG